MITIHIIFLNNLKGYLVNKPKIISCSFFSYFIDLEIDLFQERIGFETLLFVL